MGAIKREMNNWRWTVGTLAYMTGFAYSVSLIVYQLGMWIEGNGNLPGGIAALLLLGMFGYLLFRPDPQKKK